MVGVGWAGGHRRVSSRFMMLLEHMFKEQSIKVGTVGVVVLDKP